jgi:hypothetical protein
MKNTVAQFQEFALPRQSNVKRIVFCGLAILAISVSMYIYFVGKIVFDVVGRRTAEASIRKNQSLISGLAVQYYDQVKTIDIAQAASVGLTVSHDTLYASRGPVAVKTAGLVSVR